MEVLTANRSTFHLDVSTNAASANTEDYCLWNETTGTCLSIGLELSIHGFNIIIIIVNSIHISIIRQVARRKWNTFTVILCTAGVFDIVFSLCAFLSTSCAVRKLPDLTPVHQLLLYGTMNIGWYLRYLILLLLCIDRMIALRFPFKYHDTFLYTRPVWTMVVSGFSAMGLLTTELSAVAANPTLCVDIFLGFIPKESPALAVFMPCHMLIASVCIIFTMYELRRMRNQVSTRPDQASDEVVMASRYMILTTTLFYVCFIPNIVRQLLKFFVEPDIELDFWMSTASAVTIGSYGVLNTLIYGVMSASYRQTLKQKLRACCSNRVSSIEPVVATQSSAVPHTQTLSLSNGV